MPPLTPSPFPVRLDVDRPPRPELMRLAELVGSNGLIVIEDRLTKPTSKLADDIRVRPLLHALPLPHRPRR